MMTAMSDDLFTRAVTNDPYTYFGHLREEDPVHWNELYELWVITRHDDLVWLTRHHELFSSEVLKRDPRPPYPQVDAADLELYEYVRGFSSDQFIQHDRPEHLEMRKVIHGYFTPRSMEAWRPMVQSAITDLLDDAEAQGCMDVMADLPHPCPCW
jgi:cytochrome P450